MIKTERLILRNWREEDVEPFAAMGQDPEVMRHFPALLSHDESVATFHRARGKIADRGYGFWALERRSDGVFLGFTGIQDYSPDLPLTGIEAGWRLARHAWGQGYASEAARAALAFAFETLNAPEVSAITATSNLQSQAVMRRIGMTARPELDFDHPSLAKDSPLLRHVVYAIAQP
ncbi:RimJ/RimL family protein N-acetyltransferase [Caulobacter ginsengisoli]|uniref:RimJ/RimL family protein N-acetyltransferase n=1 Tax=Caulobacter ginsengisoli TaxID=400775 RepID=A0ABU0IWX3_9CAUL|nr:GNAT family N-acetyltransferase [Caulobacter ginsengisoli]MDQ0466509.1 RimJ/RimL family protein N-acetyltransferase [Caulobacter ginsengisoli]